MQEGETQDAGVLALRGRQMRNLMLALMVSQGTPMVLMGARSRLATAIKCLGALNALQLGPMQTERNPEVESKADDECMHCAKNCLPCDCKVPKAVPRHVQRRKCMHLQHTFVAVRMLSSFGSSKQRRHLGLRVSLPCVPPCCCTRKALWRK